MKALATLLGLVVAAGATAERSAVALIYHHVASETPEITSVSPGAFTAQVDHLERNGYRVLPLAFLARALLEGRAVPAYSVAISFDDAWASIYHNARPPLAERGLPYTVFVSTEAVDRALPGFMTWDELRTLAAAGVEIGNHGHTHDHLLARRPGESRDDWLQRVRADIEHASRRIEAEIGRAPRLFAWPYGEFDADLLALVNDLGLIGFGQQSGAIGAISPRGALPRFPVAGGYAGIERFAERVATLALPGRVLEPRWRLTAGAAPPELRLEVAPSIPHLNCFLESGVPIEVRRIAPNQVRVRAAAALEPGRHKYTCTAPGGQPGRYYWFSHPWFVPTDDGRWLD